MSINIETLITDKLDIWSTTIDQGNVTGRGRSKKINAYGIRKLRELIFELAVRGKLVKQATNAEPVSALLEKIAKEKQQLIESKKIKRIKPLIPISEEEKPYELPIGWEWVRLQTVSKYIQRGKGPKYSEQGKVRVVSQKCIQWSGFDLNPARFVDDESLEGYQQERYLKRNDLLWNSTGTGTVGRVNKIDFEPNNRLVADSHVTVIRLSHLISSDFITSYLSSPNVQNRINSEHSESLVSGTTKQVELNTSKVNSILVPIAPAEEQVEIARKVKELLSLCNHLEDQILDGLDSHQKLAEALLDSLIYSKSSKDQSQNWLLLSEHFYTLFTTEKSIESLKQAIKLLAVTGKLIKQSPVKEAASQLLDKISLRKEQLIANKEIKRPKAMPQISEDEKPFDLPVGWEWCRLQDIALYIQRGKSPKYSDEGLIQVISQKCVQWAGFDITPARFIDSATIEKYPPERFIKKGDLIWNSTGTGTVGRINLIRFDPENSIVADSHVTIIRLHPDVNAEFIEQFISSNIVQDRINPAHPRALVSGSTKQVELNTSVVASLLIPLPPTLIAKKVLSSYKDFLKYAEQLELECQECNSTKIKLTNTFSGCFSSTKNYINSNQISNGIKTMNISTSVSLEKMDFEPKKYQLASILLDNEKKMDAKDLWEKSKLSLPDFYQSLKNEIEQGIIKKPDAAEYSEK